MEFGLNVAPSPLAVVGQEQERNVLTNQYVDELIGPWDQFTAAVDDAIHVDQKARFHQITARGSGVENLIDNGLPILRSHPQTQLSYQ